MDATVNINTKACLLLNTIRTFRIEEVRVGFVTLGLWPFTDLIPRFQIRSLGQGEAL